MTLAMATGSVLGGLLPDIDNVHSQIGSRLPVVELIVHGCQRGIRLLSGGVPLLIPFSVARIRVCNFRTGGIMDKLWRLVMYFGIGYLGLSELYQIVSKYIRI